MARAPANDTAVSESIQPRATTKPPAAARIAIRGEETKEKFLNMVDLEAMGLDDVSQVKFTASSGEQFDYIGPSFLEER